MLYKDFGVKIQKVDDKEAIIEAVFSTADEDRHGEIVDQKGWLLDEYKTNPVILWGHDHSQPAIGKAIDIGINKEGNLSGSIKFAVKENPFAKVIYDLFTGGFMKAFSVGYMNIDQEISENQDGSITPIHRVNKLYEISAVNVGANAMALAKQKGIDVTQLTVKDLEEMPKLDETIENEPKTEEQTPIIEPWNAVEQVVTSETEETLPNIPETEKTPEISEIQPLSEPIANDDVKSIIEKEGRVLSRKNKDIINNAINALNELVKVDSEEDDKQVNRSKLLFRKDVRTIKVLNKTIRVLIKNKNEYLLQRKYLIKY